MAPIITEETNLLNRENSPLQENEVADVAGSSDDADSAEKILERKLAEVKEFAEFLDKRQDEINQRRETLDKLEKKLRERELEIETEALQRRNEHVDELQRELAEIRTRELEKLNVELDELRQKQTGELNQELDRLQEKLRESKKALADTKSELEQERKNHVDELQRELDELRAQSQQKLNAELDALRQKRTDELAQELAARREELSAAEKTLEAEKSEVERAQKNVEFDRMRLKKFDETLKNRQATLEDEIQANLDARHKSLEAKLESASERENFLIETLRERESELNKFQKFCAVYGDTPEILTKKMNDLRAEKSSLEAELGKRPGEELQSNYDRVEAERNRLLDEHKKLNDRLAFYQEQVLTLQSTLNENTLLKTANENINALWNRSQEIIDSLNAQIARLTAAEMTPADWDKRAASLREPYLKKPFNAPKKPEEVQGVDEIAWLNRLDGLFKEYGITFPQRILYAFHTSFKISSWSTLTVLAGVSGTGKSELPRLYSAFGGFNFISVPVQPNWDSQESMLGFFNSIDNKFDAQPVLRFLVECTEKYDNNMAIVLLDEMNLAHVEHYFADFLSKLEVRRSAYSVPEIYVNLGAGVKPYGLPLKRNILWCGTMNQDETTKSLSDKVLDRSIVINFPRPRKLASRGGARLLEKFCENRGIYPMSVDLWKSWLVRSLNLQEGDQRKALEKYRNMLEEMNEHLSHAGRAIGHRVWQSIEHYVINYPTVRAALKSAGSDLTGELSEAIRVAVEDQIVQKVMPKLRGIETRGKSYENCLVPIRGLLNDNGFNLNDDFDRACEMGYGQFMWSSAEYIGKKDTQENAQ